MTAFERLNETIRRWSGSSGALLYAHSRDQYRGELIGLLVEVVTEQQARIVALEAAAGGAS